MDKIYSNVVTTSFVRVIKKNGKYTEFVDIFNRLATRSNSDNPFCGIKDINQLMEKLHSFSTKQYNENSRKEGKYEFITLCVNNLLHFIGEHLSFNKQDMGMIGQEIFDIACCQLFGEEYERDMSNMNHGAPRPRNAQEAMMIGEFMGMRNNGHNISWKQFLRAKGVRKEHNLFPESFQNKHEEVVERSYDSIDELIKQFLIINDSNF